MLEVPSERHTTHQEGWLLQPPKGVLSELPGELYQHPCGVVGGESEGS